MASNSGNIMGKIDGLKNTGYFVLNDGQKAQGDSSATFVVFGVPRSGTSVIAGVLHHLGVFMGDEAHPPVYEDQTIIAAMQRGSWRRLEEIIKGYDRDHAKWGFKRPELLYGVKGMGAGGGPAANLRKILGGRKYLPQQNFMRLDGCLRNPRYIITYRDVFAVANRNRISMNEDLLDSMETVLFTYQQITKLLKKHSLNALLISLEKALSDKEALVEQLIDYCGLEPTAEQRQAALDFIQKNPKKYLDESRKNKSFGYLDKAGPDEVVGWARYLQDERTALVELYIDGRKVAGAKADIFREDLLKKDVHSTGLCGFRFTDFDHSLLKSGCEVRVRASEDVVDIDNSPMVLE